MNPLLNDLSALSDINPLLLTIVLVWSLIWKGLALWKAASRKSKGWFIALLVINTVGILEILYLYVFSEIKFDNKKQSKKGKLIKSVQRKAFLDS